MKKVGLREKIQAMDLAFRWTYESSKKLTLVIIAVIMFTGLLTIVEPYTFKLIIDHLIGDHNLSLASQLGIGIIGVLIVYGIARTIQSIMWDVQTTIKKIHSQKLDKYVSKIMMNKISSLDSAYFENPEYYNTLEKANQNFHRVDDFFWRFTFFLSQFVNLIVRISALLVLDIRIVLLVLIAMIPSIFLAFKQTEVFFGIFDLTSPIARKANYYKNLLTERPEAIKEIKLFGLKQHFIIKFDKLLNKVIKQQEKGAYKEVRMIFLASLVEGITSVIAGWIVIKHFINGNITIGELTFYWALLFQFAENAKFLVTQISNLNETSLFLTPFLKIV